MRKFVVTTALALVLAGSAYAQGHHGGSGGGMGGGGGGGMGGGGGGAAAAHIGGGGGPGFSGGAAVNGGGHFSGGGGGPSMISRGPSGASTFNGGSSRQFSRTNQGPQGRTVYNQERGNRNLYNRYEGENRNRFEGREGNRFEGREGNRFANREGNRIEGRNERGSYGIHVGHANINEFRHGINHGNFFFHGRHFAFRRFWNGQWVFLTGWDDCTAWVWVAVAPGVFAWAPIDVCIG